MIPASHSNPPPSAGEDIRLIDTAVVLWRYKAFVIGVPIALALVAVILAWRSTPEYEAIARVEVRSPSGAVIPIQTVESFRTRVGSLLTAEQAVAGGGLAIGGRQLTAEEVVSHVTAQTVRNSSVILIRARFPEPELAARVANVVADTVAPPPGPKEGAPATAKSANRAKLEEARLALQRFYRDAPKEFWQAGQSPAGPFSKLAMEYELLMAAYRSSMATYLAELSAPAPTGLVVVDRAIVPVEPVSPRTARDVAIAFAVGLVAAAIAVLLVDAVRVRLATLRARG